MSASPKQTSKGFTLIELSVILTIIALIASSIIVARDLIKAATIRAQLSQIEEYNTAVHAFRSKYNGLPGDIHYTQASAHGLFVFKTPESGTPGYGNNDGIIQPCFPAPPYLYECGEVIVFWRHLSEAGFADGNFGQNINPDTGVVDGGLLAPAFGTLLPQSKLKPGAYLSVSDYGDYVDAENRKNYFYIASKFSPPGIEPNGKSVVHPELPSMDVYEMDQKIDDGLPRAGKVRAFGLPACLTYIAGEDAYVYTLGSDSPACIGFFEFN